MIIIGFLMNIGTAIADTILFIDVWRGEGGGGHNFYITKQWLNINQASAVDRFDIKQKIEKNKK